MTTLSLSDDCGICLNNQYNMVQYKPSKFGRILGFWLWCVLVALTISQAHQRPLINHLLSPPHPIHSESFRDIPVSRHFSCAVILALSLRSLSATSFESSVTVIKIIDVSDPFVAPVAANWEANLRRRSFHLYTFVTIVAVVATTVLNHHVASQLGRQPTLGKSMEIPRRFSAGAGSAKHLCSQLFVQISSYASTQYSIDLDGSNKNISSKHKGLPTHTLTSLTVYIYIYTHNPQWSGGTHHLCHIERKNIEECFQNLPYTTQYLWPLSQRSSRDWSSKLKPWLCDIQIQTQRLDRFCGHFGLDDSCYRGQTSEMKAGFRRNLKNVELSESDLSVLSHIWVSNLEVFPRSMWPLKCWVK